MARFAEGDAAAFEALYARHETWLYGFCVSMLSDADMADDAFQETFIRVVATRSSYTAEGRFRPWLLTIARRICLDAIRRRQRMPRSHETKLEDVPDRADPAGMLDARDQLARLLSQLPAEQREMLLLHRYQGLSFVEIAELTESSEAGVKQRAYRALCRLREIAGEMER